MSEAAGSDACVFTLFTDQPELAARAQAAGVDRIGPDLEWIGKEARQQGLGTFISDHREAALPGLREVLDASRLFVRVNPVHAGSRREVDRVIAAGAEILMLPMFHSAQEVRRFVELVDGRAGRVLLVETPAAAEDVESIVAIEGVDEVHIGITDLSIALGVENRFRLMGLPILQRIASAVHDAGLPLGVAGVLRAGDNRFSVRSDLVYAQYPRLGATRALISRSYLAGLEDFPAEMAKTRARLHEWQQASPDELEAARAELIRATEAAGAF